MSRALLHARRCPFWPGGILGAYLARTDIAARERRRIFGGAVRGPPARRPIGICYRRDGAGTTPCSWSRIRDSRCLWQDARHAGWMCDEAAGVPRRPCVLNVLRSVECLKLVRSPCCRRQAAHCGHRGCAIPSRDIHADGAVQMGWVWRGGYHASLLNTKKQRSHDRPCV